MPRPSRIFAAALALGASRWLLRARLPDDYDSIGFVRALDQYDLARLQPHFPGYPVYVALARAAHVVLAPLDAATAISALAAAATGIAVLRLARALAPDHADAAGYGALALYAAAALPWLLGGAALSDGTAAAFAAGAFACLVAPSRPLAGGLLAGLMLGTRASYWPLALSWIALAAWPAGRGARDDRRRTVARALAGGAAGVAAWLVPFAAVVGPRALWTLGRAHLAGHFSEWGGSIATRPGLAPRTAALARDLFFDGIAPSWWALAPLAALAGFAAFTVFAARRPSRRALVVALVAAGPYALWILLAQNILDQPRHALPLVIAALVGAGALFARRRALAVAAPLMMLAVSAPLAWQRAHSAPAAAQAAAWLAQNFPGAHVWGARSTRFFAAPSVAHERGWLSEVDVDLERLDALPAHLFVTSEVEPDPLRAARLGAPRTFCRDPRLDRAQPCLTLRPYTIGRAP